MPAIQPARLKIQSAELSSKATNPDDFVRAYHEFLEYYADRTYRPGQTGEPPPLLPAYHVPRPVMREVEKVMSRFANENRSAALRLADILWAESYLEFKLLAASIIGKVPPIPTRSIFHRIESWGEPNIEDRLENALVNAGLNRILLEHPALYFQKNLTWLRSRNLAFNRLGLKAIPPLIESGHFEDFPLLFKLLNRKMLLDGRPLNMDILAAIEALSLRSPEETAFSLNQALKSAGENPNIAWYVRKSLDFFPPNLQQILRETLLTPS